MEEYILKIKSVDGMKDYLPKETALRNFLISEIVDTYKKYGYQRITTPIVESAENLDNSDGGDNLRLIYRILKRGDKLERAIKSEKFNELSDLGLRYDLTLPLARYYLNNSANLPSPFKCIQIDRVYRAERPQKGRLREFVQCDIDIIGDSSINCENELIAVTANALKRVGIDDFTVVLSHREVLRSIILSCGFEKDDIDSVCITIDKLDKLGSVGVRSELLEKSFNENAVEKLMLLLSKENLSLDDLTDFGANEKAVKELRQVIETSKAIANGGYGIKFSISLVRGQGYYSGIIFEVISNEFGGTIAGGGRYDGLIGRFSGNETPAVGFSIGFERIFSLLCDKAVINEKPSVAIIYNEEEFLDAYNFSLSLHEKYNATLVIAKKKLGKQLAKLEREGFENAVIMFEDKKWKQLGMK